MHKFVRAALAGAVLLATPAVASGSPASVHLERMLGDEKPPGAQILMLDHGRVIDERNIGLADVATRRPVDAHTRFEIGSVTKQFTAAAIMQLAERKKLALSDPLGKWVPQYTAGRRVTLEQLLWQVSGIPDYAYTHEYWKLVARRGGRGVFLKRFDLNRELALVAGKPLRFRPGSAWEYSNTNYVLLGMVVAKASGMPWKQYVRTHLLQPAGMTESGFAGEAVPGGALAAGYATDYVESREPIPVDPDIDEGDGGIVSTAHDLAKWNAALYGGRIVSAPSVARMTTPGPHPQGARGYGYGIQVDTYDGVRRFSHGGGSLGYASADHVYPTLSQEVIVLTNGSYAGGNDLADAEFDDHHPQLYASGNAGVAGEVPAITALLKRLWAGMVRGHVDQSLLEPRMGRFMARQRSRGPHDSPFAVYGTRGRWVYRGEMTPRVGMPPIYSYHLLFANGRALDLSAAVTPRRRVSGLVYMRR